MIARIVLAMSLPLLPLTTAFAQHDANADRTLADYRDKNRVLLVFAAGAKDPACVEQRKLWQDEHAGFDDRQLVVIPVLADAAKSAGEPPEALARRYRVEPGSFAVILLGKDGHEALRVAKPVRADAIFEAIDAMPMRRAEMKRPQPVATARPTPTPVATTQGPVRPDLDHDE